LRLVSRYGVRFAKKSLWMLPLLALLGSLLPHTAFAQNTVGYYKGRAYLSATVTSTPLNIAQTVMPRESGI
jgi:hypothetical protein